MAAHKSTYDIFFIVILYILYRVVRGFVGSLSSRKPASSVRGGDVDDMVQDPQCGTYIPRRDAVQKMIQGRLHLFCSEECAKQYELAMKNDDTG